MNTKYTAMEQASLREINKALEAIKVLKASSQVLKGIDNSYLEEIENNQLANIALIESRYE